MATKKTQQDDALLIQEGDVLVTKEGLQQLKEELKDLETRKRQEIAQRLQDAISYGDLSENSEYQEAKEEQAFAEGRIVEVTRQIKHAKIISDQHKGLVNLGSEVEVKNLETSEKNTFKIVGATEANPFEKKISNESPLGSALIGKTKADKIKVKAPKGNVEYEVIKVS